MKTILFIFLFLSISIHGQTNHTGKALEIDSVKDKKSKATSINVNDFSTFLGFSDGDSMDKAISVLGKPSEITKGDGSDFSNDYYFWGNEKNCSVWFYSDFYSKDNKKISEIYLSSMVNRNVNNISGFYYQDTSSLGTVHFLHSKGITDKALDLFGLSSDDITKIFGSPLKITNSRDNSYFVYWYKTLLGIDVIFHFFTNEDKLYSITVRLN